MLSSQRGGVGEAERAGDILSEIRFGVVHTSGLIRAQKTAEIIMSRNNVSGKIPVMKDQRLNERHYGDLQGLNKAETAEKHGAEQVHIWRRSFDVPPPEESLKMNAERTIPYFEEDSTGSQGREECASFCTWEFSKIYSDAH